MIVHALVFTHLFFAPKENAQVLPLLVIEDKDGNYGKGNLPAAPEENVAPEPKPAEIANPVAEAEPEPAPMFECTECLKLFKSQMALNCHQNNTGHVILKSTKCKYCFKQCKSHEGLLQHLKQKACQESWKKV